MGIFSKFKGAISSSFKKKVERETRELLSRYGIDDEQQQDNFMNEFLKILGMKP